MCVFHAVPHALQTDIVFLEIIFLCTCYCLFKWSYAHIWTAEGHNLLISLICVPFSRVVYLWLSNHKTCSTETWLCMAMSQYCRHYRLPDLTFLVILGDTEFDQDRRLCHTLACDTVHCLDGPDVQCITLEYIHAINCIYAMEREHDTVKTQIDVVRTRHASGWENGSDKAYHALCTAVYLSFLECSVVRKFRLSVGDNTECVFSESVSFAFICLKQVTCT